MTKNLKKNAEKPQVVMAADQTSEALALMLNQQYQKLIEAQTNIATINIELEKRQAAKE